VVAQRLAAEFAAQWDAICRGLGREREAPGRRALVPTMLPAFHRLAHDVRGRFPGLRSLWLLFPPAAIPLLGMTF
jgi:hypothetical protein